MPLLFSDSTLSSGKDSVSFCWSLSTTLKFVKPKENKNKENVQLFKQKTCVEAMFKYVLSARYHIHPPNPLIACHARVPPKKKLLGEVSKAKKQPMLVESSGGKHANVANAAMPAGHGQTVEYDRMIPNK